jgi:hypothetical protein
MADNKDWQAGNARCPVRRDRMSPRHWQTLAALVVIFLAAPLAGCTETLVFLCNWEPSDISPPTGSQSLTTLRFEIESENIRFDDELEKIILGNAKFLRTKRALKITFLNPMFDGLKGRTSRLVIWIDRFDLTSSMALEVLDNAAIPGYAQAWIRTGTCKTPRF